MRKGCKLYKGVWLDPGSTAFQLLTEGKMKELDAHMKEVDSRYRKLTGYYDGCKTVAEDQSLEVMNSKKEISGER